jgi:succinyl-CoA synthetase beta subunit
MIGMKKEQALDMAKKLGFKDKLTDEAADQILKLYKLFVKYDCTQIEINPFGETPDKRVINFDAKLSFDDNAKFRQSYIFDMEDTTESDQREVEATRAGLNYIGLQGNIGCLVNGAGLAMATMDIIKLHGGQPANFLDVGGGVKEEQVLDAFKILFNDTQVKAVLVNIFGGIVNCAIIANGIEKACKKLGLKIPLVVRLQGTNMDEARRILNQSSFPITAENDFEKAAEKVVSLVKNSSK